MFNFKTPFIKILYFYTAVYNTFFNNGMKHLFTIILYLKKYNYM